VRTNPYTPPTLNTEPPLSPIGLWLPFIRPLLLAYALVYALLCACSTAEDYSAGSSTTWITFNIVMDAFTVPEIAAMALSSARRSWMRTAWNYFPFILIAGLSVAVTLEIWELAPTLSALELGLITPFVVFLLLLAIALNFILRSRLNAKSAA